MTTWKEDIIVALGKLGGQAPLHDLYLELQMKRGCPPPRHYKAIIRKELEYNSSDSSNYQGTSDLFYSVHGLGRGIWGLRGHQIKRKRKEEPAERKRRVPSAREISLIKAMLKDGSYTNDQILACFSTFQRPLNPFRISEIRKDERGANIPPANSADLQRFLAELISETAETAKIDSISERVIKAREAMLFAVQAYNNPQLKFKSEMFIVAVIIAWTYFLHAFYSKQKVEFRYFTLKKGKKIYEKTADGADKHWELGKCLSSNHCPLSEGCKLNLRLLLSLRHEIEHRMPKEIDATLGPKFLSCCVNFNRAIKKHFGKGAGLDNELAFALQFAAFDEEQMLNLKSPSDFQVAETAPIANFEKKMTKGQRNDPDYAMRFAFVPLTANRPSRADRVIRFIKVEPQTEEAIKDIFLKEVEKPKYGAKDIVDIMKEDGFEHFRVYDHTCLWQAKDAKNPKKNYGTQVTNNMWLWFESWIDEVRKHCQEKSHHYKNP